MPIKKNPTKSTGKFGNFAGSDAFGASLGAASYFANQITEGRDSNIDRYTDSGTTETKSGVVNLDTQYGQEIDVTDGGDIALGTAAGALSGAAAGTAVLPGIGTAVGAVIGGTISFFTSKKKQKDEEEAEAERKKLQTAAKQDAYDAQIPALRADAFKETVNSPINPIESGFAYGGLMGNKEVGNINPTDITEINTGGSHEINPNGGIPQGIGANGKVNTVEEGEVKIKTGKGEAYVFSDRLIFD